MHACASGNASTTHSALFSIPPDTTVKMEMLKSQKIQHSTQLTTMAEVIPEHGEWTYEERLNNKLQKSWQEKFRMSYLCSSLNIIIK